MFLSPFNVHVNRIPIDGKIKLVDYKEKVLTNYCNESLPEQSEN